MEDRIKYKKRIHAEVVNLVRKDLSKAILALDSTKELATSDDIKAESKWDTRGIEAGYLVGAQQRRVDEIKQQLFLLENMTIKECDEVQIGALVQTEGKDYYITRQTGGYKLKIVDKIIYVVSIQAPVVEKLRDEFIDVLAII